VRPTPGTHSRHPAPCTTETVTAPPRVYAPCSCLPVFTPGPPRPFPPSLPLPGVPSLTLVLPLWTRYQLRVYLLNISLDWLASGDFGPFAGSVSARKPCGKCLWTGKLLPQPNPPNPTPPTLALTPTLTIGKCPCSYMPSDDPRRRTVTHASHCEALKPRTHEVR